ncbi:MAG TPA: oligosaccharide flippase family protein [Mucilaginibacter sp.]|jgi:O-antigen/teichoic acid export membrane protein
MKGKLVQNLSANFSQLILNQVFGVGIFYVLSTGLDKSSFGQINLALAVLLAIFNILSFGIDQLIIKKIAAGEYLPSVLSLYIIHVLFTGIVFYGLLFGGFILFPHSGNIYGIILLIGIGKLMIFFSTPFKQAANGLEKFKLLGYMSVISNFIRCCGLIILVLLHNLSVRYIILIFIGGDVAELSLCIYLFYTSTNAPLTISWSRKNYFKLLNEALPQTGVVLITSALARFDWLFIGFMVSAIKLAEYSFAYKVFEISTLPLLAIAPLLIPRFTKLFQQNTIPIIKLKLLVRIEMVIGAFVGLLLNICWNPITDKITVGKYGAINIKTIFILSLCMPFLYLNNFLWTINFAKGRLKMIFASFVITFVVNVFGDILLIPFFKNEGAAFAFLAACIVQTVFYIRKTDIPELNNIWYSLVICTCCALISGFIIRIPLENKWQAIPITVVLYIILLFATRQLQLKDRLNFKQLFY